MVKTWQTLVFTVYTTGYKMVFTRGTLQFEIEPVNAGTHYTVAGIARALITLATPCPSL